MDFNAFIQLVSTLGFPIVMCGAMGWYVKYTTDKQREERLDLTTKHSEEMSEVTAALNNNTLAIQKLTDYIDQLKGE